MSARKATFLSAVLALVLAAPAHSGPALQDAQAVPHLDARGQAAYRDFLKAPAPRAFVIAPGGTWVWHGDMPSDDLALRAAQDDCRAYTQQTCVAYAVNDQVVFDARGWTGLWGPYLSRAEAARAPQGVKRGQRFPDVVLQGPDGKAASLSGYRGRVVVLHFWGSWCPPCQREMPELQRFYKAQGKSGEVRFVFVPVRESIKEAQAWLRNKGLSVPLHDAGPQNEDQGLLRLADGKTLKDREVSTVFPTTYVLDKHGIVVFSHAGPIADWSQYAGFLKDVAAKSGR